MFQKIKKTISLLMGFLILYSVFSFSEIPVNAYYSYDDCWYYGHDYVEEIVKQPTCYQTGLKKYVCRKCGYTYQNSIDILEHQYINANVTASTYTSNGYTGDRKCRNCGYILKYGHSIDKLKLSVPNFVYTVKNKKLKAHYEKVKGASGFQARINGKIYNVYTNRSINKIFKLKNGNYKVRYRAFVKENGKVAYSSWTNVAFISISNAKTVKKAYKKWMKHKKGTYEIIDVDGNGTPELLFQDNNNPYDGKNNYAWVLTYNPKTKKIKKLIKYDVFWGASPIKYDLKNSLVGIYFDDRSIQSYSFYTINGFKAYKEIDLTYWNYNNQYYIDDDLVDEYLFKSKLDYWLDGCKKCKKKSK